MQTYYNTGKHHLKGLSCAVMSLLSRNRTSDTMKMCSFVQIISNGTLMELLAFLTKASYREKQDDRDQNKKVNNLRAYEFVFLSLPSVLIKSSCSRELHKIDQDACRHRMRFLCIDSMDKEEKNKGHQGHCEQFPNSIFSLAVVLILTMCSTFPALLS